jgi:hypothetical protein
MKIPVILGLSVLLLTACKTETTSNEPAAAATAPETPLPAEVSYKGESSIGSRDNVALVMNWNKSLAAKDMTAAAALLADSVEVTLADGTYFNTTRDSLMKEVSAMINSFDSVKVDFVAIMPVNVKTDKGTDEWVFSWTDEHYSNAKGKSHDRIHEDYLIKNGKIAVVFQYVQRPPAQSPPSK